MRHARKLLPLLLFSSLLTVPLKAQSGSFGNSVVMVGEDLIISEPNTHFREGSVYVYRKSGDAWRQVQRIVAPQPERADGFGSALAANGTVLFIGQREGPLHVYERGVNGWSAAGMVEGEGVHGIDPGCSQYGYCGTDFGITLAADGNWLLVGSTGAPPQSGRRATEEEAPRSPGRVFVYGWAESEGSWVQRGLIAPASGTPGDRFGSSISLSNGVALIGAPHWDDESAGLEGVGRVFEYRLKDREWQEAQVLPFDAQPGANFGSSIGVSSGRAVIGAPGANESRGVVRRYERSDNSGTWTMTGELAPEAVEPGDRFGTSTALSGSDIWVGAPTLRDNLTGSTYVFEVGSDGDAVDPTRRITLTETVELDAFGGGITATEDLVVVTAPGMHHQSGSAHVYQRTRAGWSDGDMLVSPPDALGAIVGEERECVDGKIGPFDCDEVDLLSFIPTSILRAPEYARGVRTNDNWGWTDPETGREYALVGRNDGTSFIDITNPSNPVLVGDLPKPGGTPPSQLWRDIKTYKDHAFIVADGAGDHGMQVFDLTRLREVGMPPELFDADFHYRGIASSHNIVINQETGFAYAVGNRGGRESCGGGLHMINIQDPINPVFAGCSVFDSGTHDSQCVTYSGPDTRYSGREICLNSNGREFEITDVTDKEAPKMIATASSPDAGYIHQGWLTDDHRYFFQDDEADVIRGSVPTTRTLVWDLGDLEDPVLTTEFMGSLPASAHNLYLKDGFAYQANYRYGLHVLDVSDPESPVEVGFFDTTPYLEGPGFSGAWSTFPFFESGTVIVTSLQEGLFVLKRSGDRAF